MKCLGEDSNLIMLVPSCRKELNALMVEDKGRLGKITIKRAPS